MLGAEEVRVLQGNKNSVPRENADTDTEMGEGLGPRGPRGGFAVVLAKDNVEQRRGPGSERHFGRKINKVY